MSRELDGLGIIVRNLKTEDGCIDVHIVGEVRNIEKALLILELVFKKKVNVGGISWTRDFKEYDFNYQIARPEMFKINEKEYEMLKEYYYYAVVSRNDGE